MDPIPIGTQKSETPSTISTLDNQSEKPAFAILALKAPEVWQASCLRPYVTERTHAEDLDH
jgi:hypothetical protein